MSEREVVRCDACGLNQFRLATGTCRRCRRLLKVELPVLARDYYAFPQPQPIIGSNNALAKNDALYQAFARGLRVLRLARGLTQRELGARCGKTRSLISRYESAAGIPYVADLYRLATALDVPLSGFVNFVEELAR